MVEVQEGRFREDLFYRLYVVPIGLPPLRARGEDVLLIARHFLTQYVREEGRHLRPNPQPGPARPSIGAMYAREESRQFHGFSQDAEQLLMVYSWPGNVRQLQNVIRNIVVLHDGDLVTAPMLPPLLLPGAVPIASAAPELAAVPRAVPAIQEDVHPGIVASSFAATQETEILPLALVEKRMILAALRHTGQDVPRAAALLQVNPSTIYRKLYAWRTDASQAAL
jgi:two-component system repressor protein LuxO